MQLFILLYIEAGSYINEEEETWEFLVLYVACHFLCEGPRSRRNSYEKRKRRTTPNVATYHFVGYSSLYPFYCFPEKVRMRLRYVIIISLQTPLIMFLSTVNLSYYHRTNVTAMVVSRSYCGSLVNSLVLQPNFTPPYINMYSPSPTSLSSPSKIPQRRSRICGIRTTS